MFTKSLEASVQPASVLHPTPEISAGMPLVIDNPRACFEVCSAWRLSGETIALVATMGALHEGHLALIRHAKIRANRVVVSIYVNPLQFSLSEDFSQYPRTFEADLAACVQAGVDAVFHPKTLSLSAHLEAITQVVPPSALTHQLCGVSRPGHFSGVATVVLQLFNCTQASVAIFGEKDAQQLAVIRRMVQDLHCPITIEGYPIIREADGLAMSSRNQYLTQPADRRAASVFFNMLRALQAKIAIYGNLSQPASDILQSLVSTWLKNDPMVRDRVTLEYFTAVDDETFLPVDHLRPGVRVLIAGRVGSIKDRSPEQPGVRLIDNVLL
ncbi:MAG: pantoate--beta-alanine ligase [Vampirovibrionales bacterium]|nr:pantoate--beta-alanine ligase [Vampirovibrionales bacterium]